MCHPAVIPIAIAAVGTATSIYGQQQQSKAQASYQEDLVKSNNAAARKQMEALRAQEAEESESRARSNESARLDAQKAKSTATATFGEAGISGASVDALLGEYDIELGRFKESTLRQSQVYKSSVSDQIAAIQAGAATNAASINAPVAQPNYAAEAANFGSKIYGIYRDYNPPKSRVTKS